MTRTIRIIVACAALAMSAAYVLPLWSIALIAPQYPEGLGMRIRVDAIEGFKDGDLQSINGLNHYIGMKAIEPDAIPELRFMPVILAVLIVTGVAVAAWGNRRAFAAWAAVLGGACIAGVADFWKWGYEYGHELSPTAIIKIPGMTYQPPVIGSKQLLNFTATSWPAAGGWAMIAGAIVVVVALVLTFRRHAVAQTAGALAVIAASACGTPGPQAIALNVDACEFCRMTIFDARFGGEVVMPTGLVHKFDSIECLAGFVRTLPSGSAAQVYVIDLQRPGTFVSADTAAFLRGVLINGPMGKGIAAFATKENAEAQRAMLGGVVRSWADILADTTAPHTLSDAVSRARPGDTIRVPAGIYREPTITVRTPRLTIEGEGWPVLDGEGARAILVVEADSVTIRGLMIRNTGVSNLEDRAGIRVRNAVACVLESNRFLDNLFAIYLERATSCVVRDNDIIAHGTSQTTSGNGIHLWNANDAVVENNRISGHRDGIYFEFSSGGKTSGNVSTRNQRYGLHFMYSDSCRYEDNVFDANHSGVAVMYSRGVVMQGNRFEHAHGAASYGLLLKEILGGSIRGNTFSDNSNGLFLEGSSRLDVRDNDFLGNGAAARVLADANDNAFTGNRFAGNAFDVTTNSRTSNSVFDGNWWDAYSGYDLDKDGFGDVPFRPVRLFALVAEQHPEALALLRSPFVAVLDLTERVLPVLTPATLADARPLIRSPR